MKTFETMNEIKQNEADKIGATIALGGIKGLGGCIAVSSNEHPLIRLSGVGLAIGSVKSRKYSFGLCMLGVVLAKDKKKALIQRAWSLGGTIVFAGISVTAFKNL